MSTILLRTTWLTVMFLSAVSGVARSESEAGVFGKEPGTYYSGGTAGLSGADSIRGWVDSVFYQQRGLSEASEQIASPSVIYGDDDRRDIYTLTDPDLLNLAQATCLIAFGSEVSNNGNGTYTIFPSAWTSVGGASLCPSERFRGQMRMGNCSAFLVAPDLIVTAGHCVSSCGTWAFVFDFMQTDSLTPPVTIIPEDNVYFCAEIIDRALIGDLDHCLIRLDRPVVGRTPIPIRREGVVPNDDDLVVVGFPSVLPMKAAAGAIVQNNNGSVPWFQANLDTYGGNSGSMVVNTATWQIEGILVRGAPDFVWEGYCVVSNTVPNSGNPGSGLPFEEVSKIEPLVDLIPMLIASAGEVSFDASLYACDATIRLELSDYDLAGLGSYDLLLFTNGSDSETVNLEETSVGSAVFTGDVMTAVGAVVREDGLLQVVDGETVTVIYADADDGQGAPVTVSAVGTIDCLAPIISGVVVAGATGTSVTVTYATDEPAIGQAWVGEQCDPFAASGAGSATNQHEITVTGLLPETAYTLKVAAVDLAGNLTEDDNGGACYSFTTETLNDYFTEQYLSGVDLEGTTTVLIPDGSPDFYQACPVAIAALPTDPIGGTPLTLSDDDFAAIVLQAGQQVSLYGTPYTTVFVGSNGFLTFGAGDTDFSESLEDHFRLPRVSALWDDLNPSQGGTISYRQLSDRLAVTWSAVPEHDLGNSNTFQVELFFDGTVAITHLLIEAWDGLVGISAGDGLPTEYVLSDISAYSPCALLVCYPDVDGDGHGEVGGTGVYVSGAECNSGRTASNDDCDDIVATIFPGADEVLDDGVDQDCDGLDASCCQGRVGDVDGSGDDEATIGDVAGLVDHLFITRAPLSCYPESDIDQSGGAYPTAEDITISDVAKMIDHLFISRPVLPPCLF